MSVSATAAVRSSQGHSVWPWRLQRSSWRRWSWGRRSQAPLWCTRSPPRARSPSLSPCPCLLSWVLPHRTPSAAPGPAASSSSSSCSADAGSSDDPTKSQRNVILSNSSALLMTKQNHRQMSSHLITRQSFSWWNKNAIMWQLTQRQNKELKQCLMTLHDCVAFLFLFLYSHFIKVSHSIISSSCNKRYSTISHVFH